MGDFIVRPRTALAVIGLLLSLATCDIYLLIHSRKQQAVLATIADQQALALPPKGALVPPLKGKSLKDGSPAKLLPVPASPIALLVFSESCAFCRANWKHWDQLFGEGGIPVNVVMVTPDKTLTQPYLSSHPLLQQKQVILGVDARLLDSVKMGMTPQTILIADGQIKKDWAGVLSDDDMKDILKSFPAKHS
jgi:hypothetical protein